MPLLPYGYCACFPYIWDISGAVYTFGSRLLSLTNQDLMRARAFISTYLRKRVRAPLVFSVCALTSVSSLCCTRTTLLKLIAMACCTIYPTQLPV